MSQKSRELCSEDGASRDRPRDPDEYEAAEGNLAGVGESSLEDREDSGASSKRTYVSSGSGKNKTESEGTGFTHASGTRSSGGGEHHR